MFFKKPEYKKIKLDELNDEIKSEFNKRTEKYYKECLTTIKRANSSKDKLLEVTLPFKENQTEPDMEYIPNYSESFVISQKQVYSNDLIRILKTDTEEVNDVNSENHLVYYNFIEDNYLFYNHLLDSMLRLNGKFKSVLSAYSYKLDIFKSLYSNLEDQVNRLKDLLESMSSKLENYNEIENLYIDIINKLDERKKLKESIESMKNLNENLGESKEYKKDTNLDDLIERETEELEDLDKNIRSKKLSVYNIIDPITKITKKYDYHNQNKTDLTSLISNPDNLIDTERFEVFKTEILSLKNAIIKGTLKIDSKKFKATVDSLSYINSQKFYELIHNLKNLEDERKKINDELSDIKLKNKKIETNLNEMDDLNESIRDYDKQIDELNSNINEDKSRIKDLFLKYYNIKLELSD